MIYILYDKYMQSFHLEIVFADVEMSLRLIHISYVQIFIYLQFNSSIFGTDNASNYLELP